MRRSGASAILQRASSQLRGERPRSALEDDDDDIGAYLNCLSSKTSKKPQEPQWDKFGEMSDISISDEDIKVKKAPPPPRPGSKFLKKKPQNENTQPKKPSPRSGEKKSKNSDMGSKKSSLPNSKSTALSKAASFESKFNKRPTREAIRFSDSDLDMDFSLDEDVLRDTRPTRPSFNTSAPSQQVPTKNRFLKDTQNHENKKPKITQDTRSSVFMSDDSDVSLGGDLVNFGMPPGGAISEDDSMSIGKGGSKFLKKKPKPVPVEEKVPPPKKTPATKGTTQKKDMFTLRSAEKYATTVVMDTDDESMADYIRAMSPGSSVGDPSSKTPRTPRTPRAKSPPSARRGQRLLSNCSPEPMLDISEENSNSTESGETPTEDLISEEDFKVNVFDLDALEPAVEPLPTPKSKSKKDTSSKNKTSERKEEKKKTIKKKDSPTDLFSNMGLHTVDELFGGGDLDIAENIKDEDDISEEINTEKSEVLTVASDQYEDDFESAPNTGRTQQSLRSILSPTPRGRTPRSARGKVRMSLKVLPGARSPSPSGKSTSVIQTEPDDATEPASSIKTYEESDTESQVYTEFSVSQSGRTTPSRRRASYHKHSDMEESDYSEDFTTATETESPSSPRRKFSRSLSQDTITDTYPPKIDSYSDTDTYSRSISPPARKSKKKTKSVEVQTGDQPGLLYHWNAEMGGSAVYGPSYGLGMVDPSPIATFAVGPDAIEAMTAYSPSVLALNDMLKMQLQLTNQFVESQKRIHNCYISSMESDYNYTTLQDTKDYIKKHKKKTLTFKEALRQVKEDMGLDT